MTCGTFLGKCYLYSSSNILAKCFSHSVYLARRTWKSNHVVHLYSLEIASLVLSAPKKIKRYVFNVITCDRGYRKYYQWGLQLEFHRNSMSLLFDIVKNFSAFRCCRDFLSWNLDFVMFWPLNVDVTVLFDLEMWITWFCTWTIWFLFSSALKTYNLYILN